MGSDPASGRNRTGSDPDDESRREDDVVAVLADVRADADELRQAVLG